MRSNITEWRAACAPPVIHRITSNFPIASECGAIPFQRVKQSRQFQPAFRFTRLRCPPRLRMLHSGNSAFFISRSEINRGVIADITPSDLAIISRQVI
ncbi:hypothetical protein [Burkholderia orbicola]|uniref:hypothetical protein n=1 Tax=Burkholderia orbicola TaxID=2978683 RepID=UPI00264C5E58|nr:hypothetical protein [Burkholderia orbicola]MDN7533364.1 hypothetical protein [Burkholderia orbicola]